jgi:Protein of unknown function (DUF3140)
MARSKVSDEVRDEFHQVVNMASRELEDWLRTASAGEQTESLPDRAGGPAGPQIVHVLGKRRSDLTDDDIELMEAVIGRIRTERGDPPEPKAGDAAWPHRLMSLGHDPLKPG